MRKRRAASASGVGQEGERERTTDEVSKSFLMTSKPRRSGGFGMSLGDTCLLPRWCPACRWRELGPGFGNVASIPFNLFHAIGTMSLVLIAA